MLASTRRLLPRRPAALCRLAVIVVGLMVMGLKLRVAATTGGVNDVYLFEVFARYVYKFNPIMVYGHHMGLGVPYNHPPLTGFMLDVFYRLQHHYGWNFALMIRLPAIFADVLTSVLVFELVRMRRPLREAAVAGIAVSLSPVLFVISGYHGNTDPVFIAFTLLSLYLLTVRKLPELTAAAAGISFALGLSVKIVPIVALPLLLLIAVRSGWRRLVAYLTGSAFVLLLLWWPVMLLNWTPFKENVLSYAGIDVHQWGLIEFGNGIGVPHTWLAFLEGGGRFALVLTSALLPLLLAWRRPQLSIPAVGLTLMLFLLLTPADASQYLVWAAAPALVSEVWSGVAYNLAGGVFLIRLYDRWNHNDPPWAWHRTISWGSRWTHHEIIAAGIVWGVLLVAIVLGFLRWRTAHTQSTPDTTAPTAAQDGPAATSSLRQSTAHAR